MFEKLYQVDWKPDSPDKFGELDELLKSVGSLKVDDTKPQVSGHGSKSNQTSSKATSINPPVQKKPAAYRPPHAKDAASIQAELFGGSPSGEELELEQREYIKKAAEGGSADQN